MAKLKNPLLSLRAVGRLAKDIAFTRRRGVNIVESKPIPEDAKSLAQLSWRHMYQKAVALWNALSASEKQEWESLARPKHMTGFAWFISQALKPNPGLYLPLQGGTMSGDIDMAKHRLLKLLDPTDDQEAARKKYVDDAAAPADFPMKLKPALTRWVIPGWYDVLGYNIAVTAGRIYYTPIFIQETTTYIRIAIDVNALAAGTADLRIFNWSNGLPGSLVLSAGTVNTGTTGKKEIVISEELTRGYYFLAIRCTGAPTLVGINHNYALMPPVPGFYTSQLNANHVILKVDAVFADPAPAPDGSHDNFFNFVRLREN